MSNSKDSNEEEKQFEIPPPEPPETQQPDAGATAEFKEFSKGKAKARAKRRCVVGRGYAHGAARRVLAFCPSLS